jgi:hypothetical protein
MTKIALPHEHYSESHLERIKEEMRKLGPPDIKAVWFAEHGIWAALEGCHRIRAAKALGLTPRMVEIPYSTSVTTDDIDVEFKGCWPISYIVDCAELGSEEHFVEFADLTGPAEPRETDSPRRHDFADSALIGKIRRLEPYLVDHFRSLGVPIKTLTQIQIVEAAVDYMLGHAEKGQLR